ncbi:glycosyltransferase family 2 protein, partial [bacterium]|nr:glycosyltransferase family 2 protein [bacterium]
IIVVADHCRDKTTAIAREKGALIFENNDKPGKGNVLKCGFYESKGEIIIMMDADYSHRPEEIPYFLKRIEEGAGLVIGSRFLGGSDEYDPIRSFGNIFLSSCFRLFFHSFVKDALNGYKAFRREIFDNFKYSASTFEIEIELLANTRKSNMSIYEIPSFERARPAGKVKSKVVIHGFKFLWMIIRKGIEYRRFSRKQYREKTMY